MFFCKLIKTGPVFIPAKGDFGHAHYSSRQRRRHAHKEILVLKSLSRSVYT